MKDKLTGKEFVWLAPRLPAEEKERRLKAWTNEQLDIEDRHEEEREQARHDDSDPKLEHEREMHPTHLTYLRRHGSRRLLMGHFLTTIKKIKATKERAAKTSAAMDVMIGTLVKLTKSAVADDDILRFVWREALIGLPGRRKGAPRKGLRNIDEFEREFLEHVAGIRDRVLTIWKAHGVRGPTRIVDVTAEKIAVERVLGPPKDWKPVPKDVLAAWSEASRARTWEARRDELIANLESFLKSQPAG